MRKKKKNLNKIKIVVDILEQLQWNHDYQLGKIIFSAILIQLFSEVLQMSPLPLQLHLNQYRGKGVK